jgi:hypothetical protein
MRRTAIKKSYVLSLFLMILTPVVLFPTTAGAYIDPNTGGYVFQILFPVLSAIAGMFLFFRNFIKQLFVRLFSLFHKKDSQCATRKPWTRLINWRTKAYI